MKRREVFISFNESVLNNSKEILRIVEDAVGDVIDNPQKLENFSKAQKEEYHWYNAILENSNNWDFIPYHFFERKEVALLTMLLYGYKSNIHQSFLENKDMVLKFIDIHPSVFLQLTGEMGLDKDVCIKAAQKEGSLIAYMENGYDEDILKASLSNTAIFYEDLPLSIREKKDISLIASKNFNFRWEHLPEIYKNDKEIIVETLKNDVTYFHQLSEDLRFDMDIAWAFIKSKPVKRNPSLLKKLYENTSEEVKSNIDIGRYIIKEGGKLDDLTETLAKNKDLLREIVIIPSLMRVSFWSSLKKETLQDIDFMAELMDLENQVPEITPSHAGPGFNNKKLLSANFIEKFCDVSDEAKMVMQEHKDVNITWEIVKKVIVSYVDEKKMRKDFENSGQANLVKKPQKKF